MKPKLYEAIRLGSMLRPQTFNEYFGADTSCVLGAAIEGCGMTCPAMFSAFPILVQTEFCPACPKETSNSAHVNRVMIHLNDDHRWTRERIADFVASIEPADSPEEEEVAEMEEVG